jgi:AhpC/TSA family
VKSAFGFLLLTAVSTVSLLAGEKAGLHKAPELAFTLPGEGDKLLSQYRGKVVALEFILTTCPHCQAASKEMTVYQRELGDRGLQVIDLAINALDGAGGPGEADQMVTNFSKTYQVGFPVGYLPRAQMMSFMGFTPADRMVVPQLVLIDRKGFIHYQTPATSGPEWDKLMKEPDLREHIEELLALGNSSGTHAKSKIVASAAKK